jgi:hypothetical protein
MYSLYEVLNDSPFQVYFSPYCFFKLLPTSLAMITYRNFNISHSIIALELLTVLFK